MTLTPTILELAQLPGLDPERFAVLADALRRERAADAADEFHKAFLKMAPKLPAIDRNGQIIYRSGELGTYATHEDIQDAVKPILNAHGFYQTFRTEYPSPNTVRVVAVLTHKRGHAIESAFESSPDHSGQKTSPQGRGSINTYGKRYSTVDVLNLTTRGEDKDGAEPEPEPERGPEPKGFTEWAVHVMDIAAHNGLTDLEACWATAAPEFRAYLSRKEFQDLKDVAMATDARKALTGRGAEPSAEMREARYQFGKLVTELGYPATLEGLKALVEDPRFLAKFPGAKYHPSGAIDFGGHIGMVDIGKMADASH